MTYEINYNGKEETCETTNDVAAVIQTLECAYDIWYNDTLIVSRYADSFTGEWTVDLYCEECSLEADSNLCQQCLELAIYNSELS